MVLFIGFMLTNNNEWLAVVVVVIVVDINIGSGW